MQRTVAPRWAAFGILLLYLILSIIDIMVSTDSVEMERFYFENDYGESTMVTYWPLSWLSNSLCLVYFLALAIIGIVKRWKTGAITGTWLAAASYCIFIYNFVAMLQTENLAEYQIHSEASFYTNIVGITLNLAGLLLIIFNAKLPGALKGGTAAFILICSIASCLMFPPEFFTYFDIAKAIVAAGLAAACLMVKEPEKTAE